MGKSFYLSFLILFSFVSQGIGLFSEEDIKKLSDLHIRRKRLIDKRPNGNPYRNIQEFPYMADVEVDGSNVCGGVILDPIVILTSGECLATYPRGRYSVRTGSSLLKLGNFHNVSRTLYHPNFDMRTISHNLALLYITPPIDFENSHSRSIPLALELPVPGTLATYSGWGSIKTRFRIGFFRAPVHPKNLRAIEVPILSVEQCRQLSLGDPGISDLVVCTYDPEAMLKCGEGDSGDPLVAHGHLIGIMSFSRQTTTGHYPDVSTNVVHPLYRNWIISNIPTGHRRNIPHNPHFQHHH